MNRQNIVRRLLYLRNWEFANIFLLPLFLYISLRTSDVEDWRPYAVGIFIVCFILAQGSFYWHLKLQSVYRNKLTLPSYFRRTFSAFKWVNIVLLLTYPLLVVLSRGFSLFDFQASFWSNAIFVFAILEYVNYYHYQLSHDNLNDIRYLILHRKIRPSPLSIDLQK